MYKLALLDILGLGAVGLAFLLALLAYRLISRQQSLKSENPSSTSTIRLFILLVIILCLIGSAPQVLNILNEKGRISKLEQTILHKDKAISDLMNEIEKQQDNTNKLISKRDTEIEKLREKDNAFWKAIKLHCDYRWKNCSRQESTYSQPGTYTTMRPVESYLCQFCE